MLYAQRNNVVEVGSVVRLPDGGDVVPEMFLNMLDSQVDYIKEKYVPDYKSISLPFVPTWTYLWAVLKKLILKK